MVSVPQINNSSELQKITEAFFQEIQTHPIVFLEETDLKDSFGNLTGKNADSWEFFLLRWQAQQITSLSQEQSLLCLDYLQERWRKVGMITYPHQIKTAQKVIHNLQGRAILADEVGLGKTIEAGLIIKEYLLRKLAKNFLVLTPASLCQQWHYELREKFDLWCTIIKKPVDWLYGDFFIASIDMAKKDAHLQVIYQKKFDILVVDEAHKLKNHHTQNWSLVQKLQKKFFLLLTATPLQNDLKELYNLVDLLRPGQFGGFRQFQQEFIEKKRVAKNPLKLKKLLQEVMIRNRRVDVLQNFPRRLVSAIPVRLSPAEQKVYEHIVQFIKDEYRQTSHHKNILPLLTLQREICSSSFAVAMTLEKMMHDASRQNIQNHLGELLQETIQLKDNNKVFSLINLIKSIPAKVIVFTDFIATQKYIQYCLKQNGILSINFDGSLSSRKKDFVKTYFRDNPEVKVLVATESGGEGINLQFCCHLINYDLPWNPMRIEQRIGRIHRLGQTQDVHIYNLSTKGTIEEYILELLQEKLLLFQTIVQNSEKIAQMEKDKSFEARMLNIILNAHHQEELNEGFAKLAWQYQNILNSVNEEETFC